MKLSEALHVEEMELTRALDKVQKLVGRETASLDRQIEICCGRNALLLKASPLMEAAVLDAAIGMLKVYVSGLEAREAELMAASLSTSPSGNTNI